MTPSGKVVIYILSGEVGSVAAMNSEIRSDSTMRCAGSKD